MTFQERYQYNPKTDLLGKGGFARVYKAKDTLLDRDVAIKIFNAADQDHYTVVEEIKKVIKLKHTNLLAYYDVALVETTNSVGETEMLQIGVMELANAGDLKQFAKNNPNSPMLFKLLQQVLSGLAYLHSKGIIHRDLKPQNILLLEEDGELTAKISDFGISKIIDSGTNSSSMAIGTIEYMAPEQFSPAKYGINGKIATNLDLWSFGIMVHELLTSEPLFGQRSGNTTAEQIMSAILSAEVPQDIENLPEPYKMAVKKCLVKDAKERVQKANELISLLEGKTCAPPTPAETSNNETIILPKPTVAETSNNETVALPKAKAYMAAETTILPKETANTQQADNVKPKRTKGMAIAVAAIVLLAVAGTAWWWYSRTNPADTEQEQAAAQPADTEQVAIQPAKTELPDMVYVQGGTFNMGSNEGEDNEKPVHSVTLSNFYIGKYTVTFAQYDAFCNETKRSKPGDEGWGRGNRPVINVSWDDAVAYCRWLSTKTGKTYRLPTEAEWEYAARGGNKSKGYTYSGSNNIDAVAWYSDNTAHPVGQKQANELGLYDMTGNVWEWCSDWYGDYSSGSQTNPKGASSGTNRVLRGGSWYHVPLNCRVANRYSSSTPDNRNDNFGFRVVLSP